MRKRLKDIAICVLLALLALVCLVSKVNADFGSARSWREGFAQMCPRLPAECAQYDMTDPKRLAANDELFHDLITINTAVNKQVTYKSDPDHYGVIEYFNYPADGYGDCEDYALEKRRRLVELGFPRRAMLLAIVDRPAAHWNNVLHLVLIVRTDHGDLVLDSMNPRISRLKLTGYKLVWVQSQTDPNVFDKGD
jgi:predicted transglutaminase-like cysteine proteinase